MKTYHLQMKCKIFHIALEYDRNNSLHHNAEQVDVRVVYREVQRNKPCTAPDP